MASKQTNQATFLFLVRRGTDSHILYYIRVVSAALPPGLTSVCFLELTCHSQQPR
jgi:hypothetical protein